MQHPDRIEDGVGRAIDQKEEQFIRLRAEWNHYRIIAERRLDPSFVPDVFLPEQLSSGYEDFIAKQTTGNITLMINGRNKSGSTDVDDKVDAFNSMQQAVEPLGSGDSIYMTTWQFKPKLVPLTQPRSDMANWADLLKRKAEDGVKIRIIISIHPDFADGFNSDLVALDKLILSITERDKRDNFKYIASRHPARMPTRYGDQFVGDHHQKFMVVKKGKATIAYCGGLDITDQRTPTWWRNDWVWHDIHAKLEGLIAKDIEREFVLRWNHEKDNAKKSKKPGWEASMLSGWKDIERLNATRIDSADKDSRNNAHKLQMLRTVSAGATIQDNKRDDIWQGYFKLIARAKDYLYMENQYFHEPKMADAIVKQMKAQSNLIVIVVATTGSDDPDTGLGGMYTSHCLRVRQDFFTSLLAEKSLNDRIRVYTLFYESGIVHSKLILSGRQGLVDGLSKCQPTRVLCRY